MIKEVFGKKVTNLSDEIIVNSILTGQVSASSAYLTAMLMAATPELKQLFSANLTQIAGEHTALSQLAANKGWINPYEQPRKQLLQTFKESKEILESHVLE